jgi:hypothetical protein
MRADAIESVTYGWLSLVVVVKEGREARRGDPCYENLSAFAV